MCNSSIHALYALLRNQFAAAWVDAMPQLEADACWEDTYLTDPSRAGGRVQGLGSVVQSHAAYMLVIGISMLVIGLAPMTLL